MCNQDSLNIVRVSILSKNGSDKDSSLMWKVGKGTMSDRKRLVWAPLAKPATVPPSFEHFAALLVKPELSFATQ